MLGANTMLFSSHFNLFYGFIEIITVVCGDMTFLKLYSAVRVEFFINKISVI